MTSILLLMLSTVSDVSASSVIVLPVDVSHEYRERRSMLRYHGCGKCAVCLMRDYFRYWTECNLGPTHTRWNEPWQHAVLTMSCQRQVNRRRGRCQHTRCKSALYPGHVRAVFSHNAFHKNMFDDSGSKQEIHSPIQSSISLCELVRVMRSDRLARLTLKKLSTWKSIPRH